MNKKPLVISVVILVLTISGVLYLLNTPDTQQAKQEMQQTSTTTTPANNTESKPTDSNPLATSAPQSPGAYVDYKDGVIASTTGTKVLFFHAPWCPQCRDLETDIKKQGVPSGVTIIKIDYDTNRSLRQKYGVTLQTTMVKINDAGDLVSKFVAYDDPTLDAVKKNLL